MVDPTPAENRGLTVGQGTGADGVFATRFVSGWDIVARVSLKIWLNHVNPLTGYIEAPCTPWMSMSGTPSSYRDRIYIVKDVILKLVEYGELNQTSLVSFCGLNLKKHKPILDDLEENGLIERTEKTFGRRTVAIYRPTQQGMDFSQNILEPYEKMFPRRKEREGEPFSGKVPMLLLLV